MANVMILMQTLLVCFTSLGLAPNKEPGEVSDFVLGAICCSQNPRTYQGNSVSYLFCYNMTTKYLRLSLQCILHYIWFLLTSSI